MHRPSTHASAPPAPAGVTYYPATYRGTFDHARAALAAIGCNGRLADLMIGNAKAEGSPVIAVPVKVQVAPAEAGECIGLVRRRPGGRADLFLGLLDLCRDDEAEAHAIAQALADEVTGGRVSTTVCVFAWSRQRKATQ